MALADIDDVAAGRRLRELAAANKAALDARVRQANELSEQARADFEREEADLRAALRRKAEAEAGAKPPPAEQREDRPRPSPRPRRSTLALGAEEFTLDRQARQAAEGTRPTPAAPDRTEEPATVEEPTKAEEPPREAPRRTLKLGARDGEDAPPQDRPARRRPPRPEGDDDMSGRTWLR
jgi:hypothetical protein